MSIYDKICNKSDKDKSIAILLYVSVICYLLYEANLIYIVVKYIVVTFVYV